MNAGGGLNDVLVRSLGLSRVSSASVDGPVACRECIERACFGDWHAPFKI